MKYQIKKMVLITVILVMLVISQTVSAAPLHPVNSGPVSQFVYDNFDDNVTDLALWSVGQQGGPTASEMNQRLEITLPANSAGTKFDAAYYSACLLRGDFDIQVDYELLTWPLANGVRISLNTSVANMERASFGPSGDFAGGPEVYLTDFAGLVKGITSTSDYSGKLRLERIGSTITSYYFYNGGWTVGASNSDPTYTQDTGFALSSWSHDPVFADQEVKLAFDNLMINAGELVCPTIAAPDLAITQTADHATVNTGDPIGFTITITNNGDAIANTVTLTDTLPVYHEFSWSVSGTDAAACVMTDGVVSCNFQDIEPGAVKTIRLTAPEYEYYSKCISSITSTATLMAYNQPLNKTATASVTVLCPYVFIDIDSDTLSVMAGDPVRYTFTIGNIGDGNGMNVDAFLDMQTPPGTSWTITEVTPSSAASNCAIELGGTWTELECLFNQIAPLEEVVVKVTSPTTTESCGVFGAAGGLMASNSHWIKTKMYYLTVNCPVGDTTPPVITTQPQGRAAYVGDAVSFSAAASGDPVPSLQWQVSADSGTTWTDIAGATASPLTFTAGLAQNGNQYRAVFTNSAGSATSDAAALSVSKKSATVTLANLYLPYNGQPIAATVITDPVGLSVEVTYDGSPTAPTAAGSYPVIATINDATYQGSASGTLTIQKRVAYVTPYDAYKYYGTEGPVLSGFLVNFVEADGVTATYSRTPGEAVGSYIIIGALSPNEKLINYNITYHTRTFTINPRPITVTADAKSKVAGEVDPSLTYHITNGSLAFSDAFSGALTRDPGEEVGTYAIRQGTLALDSNYTLTYRGADLTILPASVNTAPTANPGGSYLAAINTSIKFDGSLSSDQEHDSLTYAWTFGDGGTATDATPSHSYMAAGIYDVCLMVNDGSLDSVQACTIAVVYDPSAGFVTGSGWIDSPAGAYKVDPSLTGKATFGFVSKYLKGAKVPSGTTTFEFELAGLAFSSQSYEWLVVNKTGTNAQFKGNGTVNGTSDPNGNAYKFMLWAGDGSSIGNPDTFRIHIWWEDAAGEHDVYDNGVDQVIGAGNIMVHTKK